MSQPHLVIAAGGTGGHMFPAQSLAEVMLRRGWRVTLSTDDRGARYAGNFPDAVPVEQVKSATFSRGGPLAKLGVPLKIAGGILAARARFRADRPTVVAGFGGYPSIPALGAAWLMGLPRLIHEQNGVLGRVNQLFAPRVDAIACGTWPTALPGNLTGQNIGNPVRQSVLEHAAAPYKAPGDGPLNILVMGGSQGARILSDVVPAALTRLPEGIRDRLQVHHQARPEDAARVTETYAKGNVTADVQPFFQNAPDLMADAQLVITRSGASTVADLSVIGRPSILIPFAAATADHQAANARGLVDAGAAEMIRESELDPASLCEHVLAILGDPDHASSMAKAALGTGKPDAAIHLADLVETLAKKAKR